ncbi:hypothetical protein CRYPA_241 [uncultured Candidatus Thioglobus sp.]|nr:hypothetical protein CRYPA_241 [uncultured Candidatus Thioglobus sp.]
MFNTKKSIDAIKPSQAPTTPSRPITGQNQQINHTTTDVTKISKCCVVKGDVTGTSDIEIYGQLEGTIDIKNNTVTIEKSAKVKANILAKIVKINGETTGNIEAESSITISETGKVTGDMLAPKIILKDGSYFKGNVSMVEGKIANKGSKIQKNASF